MGFFSRLGGAIRDFFTGNPAYTAADLSGPINRLYVGNLSYRVKEEELRALFAKYGRIKTLHLIRDRITRRMKGYAFIEMPPDDARKALELNGHDFLGRKLIVSAAKSKQRERAGARRGRPQGRSGGGDRSNSGGSGSDRGNSSGGGGQKWRNKRRNGPKVYGQQGDGPPIIPRYE